MHKELDFVDLFYRRTEIFLNMLQDTENHLAECIALNNNRIPDLGI